MTRTDIRRYAAAVGATNAIHHDLEAARRAGYRDLVAPASLFCSLGLSLGRIVAREDLGEEGLPLSDDLAGRRVVAGETEIEWSGDIVAGDEITVEQRLVDTYERVGKSGRLEFYVYQREYRRADELLVRERFTRIAR